MSWGRRILLFPLTRMAIWTAITALFYAAIGILLPRSPYGQWILAVGAALSLIFVGVVIERKRIAEIGFGARGALKELAQGFGLAALLMGSVIGVMALLGWYRVAGFLPNWAHVLYLLGGFFFVALVEETAMRGVLFRMTEDALGSWIALVINSLVFGLLHLGNPNATVIATLAIAVEAGLLLTAAFMLTRSLWLAIGLHWGWNFVQGPLLGAPVSGGKGWSLVNATFTGPAWATGGAFGPEAGLICLVIATAAGVWLLRLAQRRGHVAQPFWSRRKEA